MRYHMIVLIILLLTPPWTRSSPAAPLDRNGG